MKRFLVFAHDIYYPSGGMHDFIADCNTLEEARDVLFQWIRDNKSSYDINNNVRDWASHDAHIYDTTERTIAWEA